MKVRRLADVGEAEVRELLRRLELELEVVGPEVSIPGTYWGEPEAGLVGGRLHARGDTPLHSVLHEASHYVCMTDERRRRLEREAGGDDLEESGVCYFQVLLAGEIPAVGRDRVFLDMDRWGYSFRLGSTRSWFEEDAEDARAWLVAEGLVTADGEIRWRVRR